MKAPAWIENKGQAPRTGRGKEEPMVKVRLRIHTRNEAEAKDWRPVSYWRHWGVGRSGGDIMEYLLKR